MAISLVLSDEEKTYLGCVACMSIEAGFSGAPLDVTALPEPPADGRLREQWGSFVTLNGREGHLRGCIGTFVGREPLYHNISHMAYAAAFRDQRFPPLRQEEWAGVSLHISILGPMTLCPDTEQIEIGTHGLLLRLRGSSGIFLPQVAVEAKWNRLEYLEGLCRKAKVPPGSWKDPEAQIYWYEALVFPVVR